jgi:hypothetical protein
MQHALETMLARSILSGDFTAGDKLIINAGEHGLFVEKA